MPGDCGDPLAERAASKVAEKANLADLIDRYEDELKSRQYIRAELHTRNLRTKNRCERFGILFERGLDPDKRSQLGAHYTDREKIMMFPVISIASCQLALRPGRNFASAR